MIFNLCPYDMLRHAINQFATLLHQETQLDEQDILRMIEIPPASISGDLAFPCFQLAKQLRQAPPAIAQMLAEKLQDDFFDHFEAVGGYLNAHLKRADFMNQFFSDTQHLPAGRQGSTLNIQHSKSKILLEYMAANPNKPLHI